MKINQIRQLAKSLVKGQNVKSNNFNKAGNRLAAKLTLPKTSKIEGIKTPKNTASIDIVKIEKNFGESSSDIISFKNKDGFLIKRIRTDNANGNKLTTESNYKFEEYYNFALETRGKLTDIKRTTKLNDELQNHTRDMVSIVTGKTENTSPATYITRSRLDTQEFWFGGRKETQKIESKIKGDKSSVKFLETKGTRRKDGKVQLLNIKGNTKISPEEFAKDPYIMTRIYPNKDFIHSIKHYISDTLGVPINTFNLKTERLKNYCGYYKPSTNTVVISPNFEKFDLVNTVAHELRHKKQALISWRAISNYLKGFVTGNYGNKNENILGLKFLKGNGMSVMSLNGKIKKYYNACILEKDARKYGTRFEKQYQNLTQKLSDEFPYAANEQLGQNVSLDSLGSIIKKAEKEGKIVRLETPIFIDKK